jgi:hypothetical protein
MHSLSPFRNDLCETKYALDFPLQMSDVFSLEDGDNVSPKRWYVPTRPDGVTTQNVILAAVRTQISHVLSLGDLLGVTHPPLRQSLQ